MGGVLHDIGVFFQHLADVGWTALGVALVCRWNWMASVLLGSTFLMSFSAYRVLHLRHHRYLGDPRDPDDYHNYSRSRPLVWCLHFVRLTMGPVLYVCLIPVLALKHGSLAQRKLIGIEYTLLARDLQHASQDVFLS